jgi:hypothetical protein
LGCGNLPTHVSGTAFPTDNRPSSASPLNVASNPRRRLPCVTTSVAAPSSQVRSAASARATLPGRAADAGDERRGSTIGDDVDHRACAELPRRELVGPLRDGEPRVDDVRHGARLNLRHDPSRQRERPCRRTLDHRPLGSVPERCVEGLLHARDVADRLERGLRDRRHELARLAEGGEQAPLRVAREISERSVSSGQAEGTGDEVRTHRHAIHIPRKCRVEGSEDEGLARALEPSEFCARPLTRVEGRDDAVTVDRAQAGERRRRVGEGTREFGVPSGEVRVGYVECFHADD